jgi:ATP-binding cassette subfamily B protein
MNTESKKSKNHQRAVVAYYWRHACAYPKYILGVLCSIPLTVLVNNYLPALVVANVLGTLSKGKFDGTSVWHNFGPELLAYITLLLLGIATWRIVDFFMWRLEQNVQQDIAEEVFSHMLSRSADFHANNFSGSLVSHTNKLLGGYVRSADTTIFQVYPMVSGIIITAIILWPRAPFFVLGLLAFASLYIAAALSVSRPVRALSAKYAAAESAQTGVLADVISNIMAVKSFASSSYEKQRFHKATRKTKHRLVRFARIHQRQMILLGFFNRILSGFALAAAVIAVMVMDADIATVFLILSYTMIAADQLFRFGNDTLRSYNRAFGDASAMVTTLAQEIEIKDPVNPKACTITHGTITFDNITFTHNGADDAIFNNLNVMIANGEKVGLVGSSGSGKSTLLRLLMRFSDLQNGRILIDGQNIAHITQDALHTTIAYVPQEPLLFHRSIQENIGYGKPSASFDDIQQAARLAHADEFIAQLPNGYDTLVGERGVKLSGGQRQRVAIARAMLKDAPILVLDEATSALDSESEVLIQDALWKLMESRTAIVIAHRLSTIQKMDRIIVLDNGRIVEEGSHAQLLARGGTYARLWAHQSGGFIDE